MAAPPPWRMLRKPVETQAGIPETVAWETPAHLHLEKHLRFYRDLLRSTERVELTLAHSGKTEVFESHDDPSEAPRTPGDVSKGFPVILVSLKGVSDPRSSHVADDGHIDARPEYQDPQYLRELLLRRSNARSPFVSNPNSAQSSPKGSMITGTAVEGADGLRLDKANTEPLNRASAAKPPPPPGGPPRSRPPPPPKEPPPEKRGRVLE